MDVLYLMKSDREAIGTVFTGVESASGVKERRQAFEALERLLGPHLEFERDYLFPEISGAFAGSQTLVDAGTANVTAIERKKKAVSRYLAKPAAEQKNWAKQVKDLRELVEKHFSAELESLFPKVRHFFRTEDREDLGQVFQDFKEDREQEAASSTAAAASRKRA